MLIGAVGAAAAALIAAPGIAWADPDAPPPAPNINAFAPISPADFSVMSGAWYAFATPDGLTCVIQKGPGDYGCSGPIPNAPDGANMVSGGPTGAPGFANADASVFAVAGPVKPLPPKTRLSYRQISCGTDGAGTTSCLNSYDQSGFVIGPGGSYIVGQTPPLLDRPRT
ncbi:MAG: hypothetical protein JO044_07570 [Mycobacteriaceae bacterium]|nr:hypothetical protein [Mycobacteriaceae bacterium]MBV9641746.1 hypothetical protein [Mycobacteriaceae bacterium]